MTDCTPRELRIIADHLERLTKARVVNQQLGVPTTPDVMVVNFPNDFTGTIRWTPGRKGDTARDRSTIARHARHRDAYLLDAATLRPGRAAPRPAATAQGNAAAALNALQAGARAQAARTTEPGARQHPA